MPENKGDAYEINFDKMTETNVVNGWQRKIRIQPNEPNEPNEPLTKFRSYKIQPK